MERPSVRQLEVVVAVAELRNFRRAAAQVGISQPALSMQLATLERSLGAQLFERDRRSVLITAIGEEVVARARAALNSIDEVAAVARRRSAPLVGPLRMGVIPTIAPYLLPPILPALRKRFPQLSLQLREDQTARLLEQLDRGQLDVALLALPVDGDFTAAKIADEQFVVATAKGVSIGKRGVVRQEDLATREVLLLDDGHCLRDQALAVCSRAGGGEVAGVRATSLPTLVQMVAGGLGMTILPASAAAVLAPARGSSIEITPFAAPVPGRTIGLVWRTSSGRLREFRLLADELADRIGRHLDEVNTALSTRRRSRSGSASAS